ncbi:hypothetical protein AVEN_159717-1 [Araneus ventricosus]|uniref:Uncharacterized protein n=1 Tax=Araneus ventricosus TaxID=182803 RepID=A0A4Y2JCA8_ARAVE|nr:hypothetical protein AVEN_159717-1 [Araneus ventricosus]
MLPLTKAKLLTEKVPIFVSMPERYWTLFFHARGIMDPALQAYLDNLMEANEKEKEGRPPTPMEMDTCAKLEELDV